jgi:solute:Na+ symporter, SSS family
LTLPDYAIIFAYLIFILLLGLKKSRNSGSDLENYILAGRRLTLPAFVATLVSTWYGGILGVGEFSYLYGLSSWLVFGVPYYVAAVLFALLVARAARRQKLYTIPEQLQRSYGRSAAFIGTLFVFILTLPAAYVLMLAVLLQYLFPIPLFWAVTAGMLFSMIYVLKGGFDAIIRTDKLQFSLMYIGFFLILLICLQKYGGYGFLKQSIPESHFQWHGGQGAAYIIAWFFIALTTLIDPSFYQRCFAAKNDEVARRGILISVLFWIVFDFMTTFTGLYARAVLPELDNPVSSYLELAGNVLPPVVLGLFFTALLATIMSTIDSFSFLAAITIGRDFRQRYKKEAKDEIIQRHIQIGLIITAVISIALALYARSVVKIWKDIGSLATPALLIPLVSSFFNRLRMPSHWVPATMISGAAVSAVWLLSKELTGSYLFQIEPIYPGLVISFLLYLAGKGFAARQKQVQ